MDATTSLINTDTTTTTIGTFYSFIPSASDQDNNLFVFSIDNKHIEQTGCLAVSPSSRQRV